MCVCVYVIYGQKTCHEIQTCARLLLNSNMPAQMKFMFEKLFFFVISYLNKRFEYPVEQINVCKYVFLMAFMKRQKTTPLFLLTDRVITVI